MTASVTNPSGITELCDIVSLDDNHYSIKFVPKEMGVHTVSVKHKDMHIPGKLILYMFFYSAFLLFIKCFGQPIHVKISEALTQHLNLIE